jgi:hypothetical protein
MISVVDTPNPDTKKFIFDKIIVEEGSKEFTRNDDINLKIVKSIFSVNNIDLIYFDKNFISIRKAKDSDWDDLTKELLAILNSRNNRRF